MSEGWNDPAPPREPQGGSYGHPQPRDAPPAGPAGHPAGYPPTAPAPYGRPGAWQPAHGQPPSPYAPWRPPWPLASWGQRLGAYLLDVLLVLVVALVPGFGLIIPVLTAASRQGAEDPPGRVVALVAVGIAYMVVVQLVGYLWYMGWRQGATGQTIGKRAMGVGLVDMHTGQPMGATRGLGRAALRLLLSSASVSILSFLWPLWDAKRQTWEDMAFKSVVVRVPRP